MSQQLNLQKARLIKRYKRFLVDVEQDGQVFTIYCNNTGAMTGCAEPGFDAYFSTSDNPKRKYQHTLEKTVNEHGHFIGVNTIKANDIVKQAIEDSQIDALDGYDEILTEVKYGEENSRIDLLLKANDKEDCYVEVKSTTLMLDSDSGLGAFPDAKSVRGQKHLRELAAMKQQGKRAVLVFLVQHNGIKQVTAASHIDPVYSKLIEEVLHLGVEILVVHTHITAQQTTVSHTSSFVCPDKIDLTSVVTNDINK